MSTHNLCFRAKNKKKMYTPVHPSFTISSIPRALILIYVCVTGLHIILKTKLIEVDVKKT